MDMHFIYPVCILLFLILQNIHARIYEVNSISKLKIQVLTYVFELSAGKSHR